MAKRRNIQPETLVTPRRKGAVLYSDAVSVEGRRMVFIAGQLSRDGSGNVVGKGDMRAQIRQCCENITVAAGHFPAPGFGRILRLQDRRYWQGF